MSAHNFQPHGPIDGAALRASLTDAAHAFEGDDTKMRTAATLLLKQAYADAHKKIRAELEGGAGGIETARRLSLAADEIVSALYDFATTHMHRARNPTVGERLGVCAVGGFGRAERAPYSDIDLLFVHPYKLTPWAESVVETMLYALWDMRLKVGYSVRTVDGAIRLAREDWTVLTAMLDVRRVAGDAELPVELLTRLETDALQGRAREFVAAKLAEREARLAKQGASRYMVEPDVKDGAGGQRDLQLLEWLSRGVTLARGEAATVARLFQAEEALRYESAADFLWRVRCLMHFTAGRSQERLTFDLQPEIARAMGFVDDGAEAAVERFMRRYFLVVRESGALTSILCAKLETEEARRPSGGFLGLFKSAPKIEPLDDGRFELDCGLVDFAGQRLPQRSLADVLSLCVAGARHETDLHPDALSEIARSIGALTDADRSAEENVEAFLSVFDEPEFVEQGLRLMNESGVLGAFLPEFGRIVARTQFNMYHHYTVDEHILRVVGALADLEAERAPPEDVEFAKPIFDRVQNRRALYLAALLHDVGKGLGDQEVEGAKLARRVVERFGFNEDETALVEWLVAHHLLASDVAQRRDIGDPRTMIDLVEEVKTPERMRLLTLLTVADISGVGPGVWTVWKGRLLEDLHELAIATFHGGRATIERVRDELGSRAKAARQAVADGAEGELAAFTKQWCEGLEDAYWLAFEESAQRRHRDFVFSAFSRGESVAVDARQSAELGVAELLIYAPDKPGLFAALTHAIAGAGADVRGARLFSSSDGGVFDVFSLSFDDADPAAQLAHLTRVAEAVREAARDPEAINAIAPPALAKPPRRMRAFRVQTSVAFDDEAAETATVIEVTGRDRRGLLASLARTLADAGVNVVSAHVASYGERAMDVIYAVEADGARIADPDRRDVLRAAIIEALEDPDFEGPAVDGRQLTRARASAAR